MHEAEETGSVAGGIEEVEVSDARTGRERGQRPDTDAADLVELFRIHDVALDLIAHSDDEEALLDRVLDEYERRLDELPSGTFTDGGGKHRPEAASKVRALVMFATQAAALREKAAASRAMAERTRQLEEANRKLAAALADAQTARTRLESVSAAIGSAVIISRSDGSIEPLNASGRELAGEVRGDVDGRLPASFDSVARNSDGEVSCLGTSGQGRRFLVVRRDLPEGEGAEVVLATDVTRRYRETEERHRLEKLSEVMRTLSVLSHKINNPLTALLGRAQILASQVSDDPNVVKAASVIAESATRIAGLVREVALVAREGREEAIERMLVMDPPHGGAGRAGGEAE